MNLKNSKAFNEGDTNQEAIESETELSLDQIGSLFHRKLKELCEPIEGQSEFLANNVWILNEISFPVFSKDSEYEKYGVPENDSIIYSSFVDKNVSFKKSTTWSSSDLSHTKMSSIALDYLQEEKTQRPTSKLHIHSLYACNAIGQCSIPLIVFPSKQLPQDCTPALYKSNCIQESQDGSLNNLNMFLEWLDLFMKQRSLLSNKTQSATVLIMNVFLLQEILKSINFDELSTLITFCENNRIFILSYPLKKGQNSLNSHLFEKFTNCWNEVLDIFMMKENVNTQKSFILIFKHVLRTMFHSHDNLDLTRELFSQLLDQYPLNLSFDLIQLLQSNTQPKQTIIKDTEIENDDESDSFIRNNFRLSLPNTEKASPNTKLTEAETESMVSWVDHMSRIGSMCIKYTFLREIYVKLKGNSEKSCNKEILAGEKHWLDFVKSNKEKFSYDKCFALDENTYIERWYDLDYWRLAYYNHMKETCSMKSGNQLWAFDVISFPFSMFSNTLRPPEKDYDKRPRNIQPRISVLFAFNATGRYTKPFFVFPFNFDDQQTHETSLNLENTFAYSLRGFVTPKVFDNWLKTRFLGEIDSKKTNVLLLCAKLPIINANNLKACEENSIKPFCVMNEAQNPFIALFNKSLRKRQTDLFLESWRRTTAQFNLSYQFKCDTKQMFTDLFENAFENCVQEMRCSSDSQSMEENLADEGFKSKVRESFQLCELWPIDEEKYKVYKENFAKKLEAKDAKTGSDKSVVQPNMENDLKTRKMSANAAFGENRKTSKRLRV